MQQSTYFYDNVELFITVANDDVELQHRQIDSLVKQDIDLLIVSPIQTATLTPFVDSIYDSGTPVIVFDRRTGSRKYTAYIGADNRDLGGVLAHYIVEEVREGGSVLEITGLSKSSPAKERSEGFAGVMADRPDVKTMRKHGDWKEESGYRAMQQALTEGFLPDYVFAQNDRMALGARRAAMEQGIDSLHYCGIDALPVPGGGMELVRDSVLEVSCIYPTHGDEVVGLAVRILEGQPFERENFFPSALVTRNNASVLLMQHEQIESSFAHLDELHDKTIETLENLNYQRSLLWWMIAGIALLILVIVISWYAYYNKVRLNEKLRAMNERQRNMTHQMKEMTELQSEFYTNVSHQLRTPLTLVASPVEQLCQDPTITNGARDLLNVTARNVQHLVDIVNNILTFQRGQNGKNGQKTESLIDDFAYPPTASPPTACPQSLPEGKEVDDLPLILIVDDNEDMRYYLRFIFQTHYRVEEAENGAEALQKAAELVPSIIVSDVMMPVMDGLAFCAKVKEEVSTSHIPVILLTARAREEQKAEGYEHGADSYLTKPFSAKVLLSRVENLLASRRKLNELVNAQSKESEIKAMLGDKDKTFYDRWKEVMEKHIPDSDISMDDLAGELGLGRVQLYRKLKALTGKAPNELLRSARLQRSRILLERTELTVSQITYEVGFTSPSYFTKCFKEEFGIGPTEGRGVES
jgi:ABC-type sugar transport system substrate-binding protein/CheY-like chemotaxis protein